MTICERIFEIIDTKQLKTADLARILNVKQSVLSNWKKRNTNPPIEYALVICEFLGISIEELLTGEKNTGITPEEKELIEAYRRAGSTAKEAIMTNARILAPKSEPSSSCRTG